MKKLNLLKILFGFIDLLIIVSSLVIATYFLRKDPSISFPEFLSFYGSKTFTVFLLSVILLAVFFFNGLYRVNILVTRAAHLSLLIKALYYGALYIVLASLFISQSDLIDSRLIIFIFLLCALPAFYLIRVELLRFIFVRANKVGSNLRVVILGDGKAGKMLAAKLMFENPIGIKVIGFVDEDKPVGFPIVGDKKVLGRFNDLDKIVKEYNVEELLIAFDDDHPERILEIVDLCKNLQVRLRITSELFDVVAKNVATEKYGDIPVINMAVHYNNALTLGFKRLFDIVASVLFIIILSPLFLLIAVAVKLSSKGPVLFKQIRVGKNGKEFEFYKFRSMKVIDGEDEVRKEMMIRFIKGQNPSENGTKVINEQRITWIGHIIRATSLDELPQLFNVLIGDMSLVGPRPSLPYEFENYNEWQKRRVSVLPGCTGVWQVWGRSKVSFQDSMILDIYYINNMSPWFDLQLLFQTIPALLTLRGAK